MHRLPVAVIAAVSVIAFTQVASAADLARKAPAYTPPPPPPVYSWAGFYIGGNAGWLGSTGNTVTNTGTDTGTGGFGTGLTNGSLPQSVNVDYSGFLGGVQVGYNWQSGSWVFGLEGDVDWASAKGSTTVVNLTGPFNPPITSFYHRELQWLSTLRGRVGITATPTFLLYATGGLAVGQTKIGNQVVCPNFGPACESEP